MSVSQPPRKSAGRIPKFLKKWIRFYVHPVRVGGMERGCAAVCALEEGLNRPPPPRTHCGVSVSRVHVDALPIDAREHFEGESQCAGQHRYRGAHLYALAVIGLRRRGGVPFGLQAVLLPLFDADDLYHVVVATSISFAPPHRPRKVHFAHDRLRRSLAPFPCSSSPTKGQALGGAPVCLAALRGPLISHPYPGRSAWRGVPRSSSWAFAPP